ncbi:putative multiple ankyrin repeats single kh domain-containing protein [Diplodia seriata]|uniref:Putative multiple ankyrin repeats single kh domain-containing protein n=1 Tax=Diplodia seriata TaxID=420778 RepID=A0A0G2GE85_9PEZI|nr:putative multiple ankyrin repeats single kh domain-containing protein [Diplodia seriata]
MEQENEPNQQQPANLLRHLWERAVNEADDDVKKALTLAKTNEHDVLLAVRKVAQEKRSQAIWKCWGEERIRGQTVMLPVRDVLEKLIRYVDLIRDRNPSIPEEIQNAWRLFWSPFWFLLRAEVQDVQMFSRTTNNLMRAARFFFMFQDCDLGKLLWFSPPEGSAEDLLSRAYAEILRLLAYRVTHAASGKPVVDSEEFYAVRRLLSGIGYACTHFRLPYMRSLDTRCQRPYEKGMVLETVVAQELHEELQSWILGKPVHVKRENLRELSEGSVSDDSPILQILSSPDSRRAAKRYGGSHPLPTDKSYSA